MKKEQVNSPSHYNLYPIEAIDMAERVFGLEKMKDFCLITAFIYRMRLGLKDEVEKDLAKEKWYLDRYKQYEDKPKLKIEDEENLKELY